MAFPQSENRAFGKRLLSHIIDERAAANHERPYAAIPKTTKVDGGFREIKYADFARAVNRCVGWIKDNVDRQASGETLAYIGVPDLRYQILALAAAKTGHVVSVDAKRKMCRAHLLQMFFPSPRNTTDALDSLLIDAKCGKIITTASPPRPAIAVIERRQFQRIEIPSLDYFLDPQEVENYPLRATWEELRFKTWLMIHTSGSTGNPKLVPIKHGSSTAVDAFQLLKNSDTARFAKSRTFVPFPPFHIAGIMYTVYIPCFYDGTVVLPPPGAPLTGELVHAVQEQTKVEQAVLVPSIVMDLAKNDTYLEGIKTLNGLTFSGGALSPEVAQLVSQRTNLASGFGASEYGGLPTLPRDPEDWQYFWFSQEGDGIEYRETDQPGLFELVLVRRDSLNLVQGIFITYPELDEFHTKDLFSLHPTKSALVKYESRLDDIIVFSNGENLNPIPMEGIITSCPDVKGCMVVGQGRMQAALLVEPTDDRMSQEDLLKRMEPFIDRANQICPKYGKISPDMSIKTAPGNPLLRAPKGTILRARNNQIFGDEIDDLYERFARKGVTKSTELHRNGESHANLETSIRSYLELELGVDTISPNDDFFALGMDSLVVINLARLINRKRLGEHPIDAATIYEHPTIAKLVHVLFSGVRDKNYSDFNSDDEDDKATWIEMEQYFQDLRARSQSTEKRRFGRDLLRSSRSPPLYQVDGGWSAWSQVLGAFLVNLNNWGLVNSFGVYQAYYETSNLSFHSPSSISWIGTVQGALLLIVGVISGPLFDRGYFRFILIGAGAALVIAMMLLSLATEYYQIMLCQGILIGICLGLLYIPSVALIPLYFKKHLGLALGLSTAGGSIGGVIYPIIFRQMVHKIGFGWANRVIGFVALVSLGLAVSLLRPIGPRSVRQLIDMTAFKDLPFVTMMFAAFFLFAGVLVPFFLATSFSSTELSLTGGLPFYFLAILNGAQAFGRVVSGALADRFGPELLLLGAEAACTILGFCWTAVNSKAGMVLWTIFYGLASGLIVTLPAAVLPWVCPNLAILGTRLGMVYAIAGLGFLMSTPVALATNHASGGYVGAQIWTGICCFVGLVFYTKTCHEAWVRRRLYESRRLRS